ncbi:GNAT family N-acetyltransferase [Paenibacillus sp. Marseille-P2973]|uniref:GNAT family N-acetyltransferase n=1 Tax=Paenibacillus TaxID=44249 RepID=UPI001B3847A8|nr:MULTISPECIES: GNAT family N-acetyltransferase [Paenibacillus]MBQ4900825.1 GNAT family N-acetyltransferase [Paenibacillus sp. Marseille-P2973]MDN4070742.1 GNAT family N-acetyltransferase [Paenibacillus vini]
MYKCGGEIPVLESERLILRRMEKKDAREMFRYWSDPEVVRYMNMPPFASIEDTYEMINLLNGLSESEDTLRWGIELKETGRLIGSCGFNVWELAGAYRGEIGYDLGREYWGRGYMSETFRMVLPFGYGTMGLNRIEALVDPRNDASRSLLRAFGFREEGLLREYQKTEEGFVDLLIYSLLKREYGR